MIDIQTIFNQINVEAKRVPRKHFEPLKEARPGTTQDTANNNEMIKRRNWLKPHVQHVRRVEMFNKLSITDSLSDEEFDNALNAFSKLSKMEMEKESKNFEKGI